MLTYLSEYIHPDALNLLKQHSEITENFDRIESIDAIILRSFEVDRSLISRAKRLTVIGKHGVGCNTIDLQAAKEYGVTVLNTPHANTNSVAELIVGLILNAYRSISFCDAKSRGDGFAQIAPPEVSGLELTGKTVGLIGMGNIARQAGEILRGGFHVTLIGYDPFCTKEQADVYGIEKYDDLDNLLEASDIITISVPLTPSTVNMISGERFNHMKKHAVLINTARGGIVNEEDLYWVLKEGRLRAAACDAFTKEPPDRNNKLMTLNNFYGTPHIGANTEEALYRTGVEVVEEVCNVVEGKEPAHRVV